MSATTSPQKEKAKFDQGQNWVKFEDTDEVQDSGGGSPSKAQDLQGPPYVFATILLVLYSSLIMLVQISYLILVDECSGFHLRYHLLLSFISKVVKTVKK